MSIEGGWLLAFEGTRPVYATLMSPGRGGAARPDEDPLETSASPTGVYPISGKLVTATMEAPGELVHSDVPFAQNIVGPYALHGAYWHDNWGNPQSGGCINLAPNRREVDVRLHRASGALKVGTRFAGCRGRARLR